MHHFHIFKIHCVDAFADKGRSVVWFLLALINPMMILIYWIAAHSSTGYTFQNYSLPAVTAYFFGVAIVSSALMTHIEEAIAYYDIQEGGLAMLLVKPYSYLVMKFFSELPYRLLQGFFGIIVFVVAILFIPDLIRTLSLYSICLGIIGSILGYFLSFFFKVSCAFTTFWLTDYRGLQQIMDVTILVTAGFIMPISSLPEPLRTIFLWLPFSGIIYHPLMLFLGKYTIEESLVVFGVQLLWIGVFYLVAKVLWYFGIREFCGVGQ